MQKKQFFSQGVRTEKQLKNGFRNCLNFCSVSYCNLNAAKGRNANM